MGLLKYYSIGEFAKAIGKTTKTLRNWDKNGKFYEVDDKKSPYYELIHQYNLLEYNNLFGKDDQQKEFFYIKN